ncbi:filamentous hemagglutinin N-terminal domain-containing protein [Leptolyngbyaceae cyanobacterium CCMR0082]|uniref:Filamentous hemagglutinin N-terminal domain-containing protein n=1 Tax=Adonisia turfae CCMR0082 TaxID=2304604 RepID=A0A6M0SEY7_9CYAN|nr:filamentous hemagglutinin N-terminal domain-containing protein [Adonisia turfae]NEZ67004.1 filamentous hemagglutinin N-terminal domain-containing protein [Adonisia turfae CCMR0082]
MRYSFAFHSMAALAGISLSTLGLAAPAISQVLPDNTLGAENSIVTSIDAQTDRIDGGALQDGTLFHSFEQFSIPENHGVYFANPAIVDTIFSRVTGADPSLLFGTLGVLGDADLVFLNPNGILFGPNAELDLRGGFTATTASGVSFPGGEVFSAVEPEAAPLLSVNVQAPVGLIFGIEKPAAIVNQGNLSVDAGQVLELSAGTLANFGSFSAEDGEVSLEAVEGDNSTMSWLAVDDSQLEALGITEEFYGAELRQDDADNLQLQGPGGYVLNEGIVTAETINIDGRTFVNEGRLDANGIKGGSIDASLQYLVNQGEVLANGSDGDGGQISVEAI